MELDSMLEQIIFGEEGDKRKRLVALVIVGKGKQYLEKTPKVIDTIKKKSKDLKNVAIRKKEGILKETVGKAFIDTKGQVTTNIDLSQKESLLLQVKGCSDLFVGLREKVGGDEAAIGIGIFSNNGIMIKPCFTCTEKYGASSAYLDCTTFKPFWITWTGLTVKIGRGHDVGMQEILSTTSTKSYKVNFLVLNGFANWIIETEVPKSVRHLYQRTVQPLEGMIDDLDVFHSFASADIIRCIEACHEIQGCQSINYNKQDGTCELFAALPGDGDFKVKVNWQSWIVVD
ncbi:uncharacterized protein [Haliotis asinina]|uniref:uncharacterized protein n=1 Tax=Haliotis asinina TaxID=109174 RepID=UPI003531A399